MYRLLLVHKAEILAEYLVTTDKIIIGSSPSADIYISHKMISGDHCEIRKTGAKEYSIIDLKSAFGILVNGEKVTTAKLNYDDEISLGMHRIVFLPAFLPAKEKDTTVSRYILVCIKGRLKKKRYLLSYVQTKIGRTEELNDIVIPDLVDNMVSRRHSTVTFRDKKYFVSDKRSTNRTGVNRRTLEPEEEIPLAVNDEIGVGRHVFRFVREGETTLAPPYKILPIWAKIIKNVMRLCIYLVALLCIFIEYASIDGIIISKKLPEQLSFDFKKISVEQTKPAPPTPFSSGIVPSLAFVNRNIFITNFLGFNMLNEKYPNKILIATTSGGIYTYERNNLKFLVDVARPTAQINVSDLNRNGYPDMVIYGEDSRIYVVDSNSGEIVYRSQLLGANMFSCPAVSDLNRDRVFDIVTCAQEGKVYFIYGPLTEAQVKIYSFEVEGEILSSPIIFVERKKTMVAICTSLGKLYIVDGFTRKIDKVFDLREVISKSLSYETTLNLSPTPVITDLDRNGTKEILLTSNEYYTSVLNMSSSNLLWEPFLLEPYASGEPPRVYSSPVVLYPDKKNLPSQMVILGGNGVVFALHSITGRIIWKYDTGEQNSLVCSPGLFDINKDGFDDLIFGSESGNLYILDGRIDSHKRLIFCQKLASEGITATPVVGDIDGDGEVEITAVSSGNEMFMLKTNVPIVKNQICWALFRANSMNSGLNQYSIKKNIFRYGMFIVICVLIQLVLLLHRLIRGKFTKFPLITVKHKVDAER